MDQLKMYPASRVDFEGTEYSLARQQTDLKKVLLVKGNLQGFVGKHGTATGAMICELSAHNAANLRTRLPWLNPAPLGLKTSIGMGDRLGLATVGHVAAVRGMEIAPIFAQQSVRENARTGRKPQEVLDDAMWGVFQSGWKAPWGADADHLKQMEDIDAFVSAGYTFFTIDPGDFVDQSADGLSIADLTVRAEQLPWNELKSSYFDLKKNWIGESFDIGEVRLDFDAPTIMRSAVKYGHAIAHAVKMYTRLKELMAWRPFDFEVSVDETTTATTAQEHFYIASELKRLGVKWTSLAPRFVGRFEKGVDYIGDLNELDRSMAEHTAVLKAIGGYKISLHSGSDKFSVYQIAAKHAHSLVHLKTAGTSYLEGLRVIAMVEPSLFRRIYSLACERYETDKATYHVSASLSKVPTDPTDKELPALLDQFDSRQVLHVTFGSVLDQFRTDLYRVLRAHENTYARVLETHFRRHISPLCQ